MARSESDSCVVVKLHRFYLSWFLHSLLSSPAVLDSDGQTVRICLPLDKSKTKNYCNKYHQTKQIDTYFPCTCKMIWLKREVGYKNVSLFGKLSRFSWNYGGLCSNFAPNSLSIEGRYGYAAVPHKERQDQSSVLSRKAGEGRKMEIWWTSVSIFITLALHKHPPPPGGDPGSGNNDGLNGRACLSIYQTCLLFLSLHLHTYWFDVFLSA